MHFAFLTKSSQGKLSCVAYLFCNGLRSARFSISVTSYSPHCLFCFCAMLLKTRTITYTFQKPVNTYFPLLSCWHCSHGKETLFYLENLNKMSFNKSLLCLISFMSHHTCRFGTISLHSVEWPLLRSLLIAL